MGEVGVLRTPKSDYVIFVQPLRALKPNRHFIRQSYILFLGSILFTYITFLKNLEVLSSHIFFLTRKKSLSDLMQGCKSKSKRESQSLSAVSSCLSIFTSHWIQLGAVCICWYFVFIFVWESTFLASSCPSFPLSNIIMLFLLFLYFIFSLLFSFVFYLFLSFIELR